MFHSIFRSIREFIELQGKWFFAWLIFWVFITAIIQVVEPIFMAKVIGYIEDFYKTGTFPTHTFFIFLAVWGGYIILSMTAWYIHRYFIADKPALTFHNQVAYKYVENVYYMTLWAYLTKKTGSIYKNFDRGASAHFQVIFFVLKDGLKTLFSLLLVLVFLIWTSPIMTLLALSMLPFMAIAGFSVQRKTQKPQRENEERWTEAFGHMGNFLSNMQLGKILLLEKKFIMKFHTELDEALHYQKLTSRWWSANDMIITIFVMISRFLVLGYGVYAIAHHAMTLASLMFVFSLIGMIYYPIGYLFGSFGNLQKWSVDLEKFYDEFDGVEREDIEKWKTLSQVAWTIEFRNVSFAYTESRPILENISFQIAPWEKVALVGNTGAGKSTIISLLFRFWNVSSGAILLDNADIRDYSKKSLRKHFGLVAQDNSLFNLSIRENLLFAKPDATEKELKNALVEASADFVFSLEKWLDTVIGERGLKLSGGEKQRLSIARLFLQNPEILILDEATSALDNATEKKIQKSLDTLIEGKTAIIIAHRLSTVKHVDRIFMIENGKIVECGSYEELIALGGKFARLADPDRLVIG